MDNVMNKKRVLSSKFACELRKKIWKEFFDFSYNELTDPISDDLWINIKKLINVFNFHFFVLNILFFFISE